MVGKLAFYSRCYDERDLNINRHRPRTAKTINQEKQKTRSAEIESPIIVVNSTDYTALERSVLNNLGDFIKTEFIKKAHVLVCLKLEIGCELGVNHCLKIAVLYP
ncbi:hypothetical protein YC2023_082607 [Brassica napus]